MVGIASRPLRRGAARWGVSSGAWTSLLYFIKVLLICTLLVLVLYSILSSTLECTLESRSEYFRVHTYSYSNRVEYFKY